MRRHHLAFLASVALFSVGGLMAACGGDDDSPPSSPTKPKPKPTSTATTSSSCASSATEAPTTAISFVAQYAPAYCAVGAGCCGTSSTSTEPCVCQSGLTSSLGLVLDQVVYDAALGPTCLNELRALVGKATACEALTKGIESCQKALALPATPVSGAKPGEACVELADCAPVSPGTARCQEVGLGDTKKTICQQVLDGTSGQAPCIGDARQTFAVNEDSKLTVNVVYRCGAGLVCDASSRTCGAGAAAGAACFLSEECGGDAYCKDQKCVASIADGSACASQSECKLTSFCSSKQLCQPYLAAGATCSGSNPDDKCDSGACLNGKCSVPASATPASPLFCGF